MQVPRYAEMEAPFNFSPGAGRGKLYSTQADLERHAERYAGEGNADVVEELLLLVVRVGGRSAVVSSVHPGVSRVSGTPIAQFLAFPRLGVEAEISSIQFNIIWIITQYGHNF